MRPAFITFVATILNESKLKEKLKLKIQNAIWCICFPTTLSLYHNWCWRDRNRISQGILIPMAFNSGLFKMIILHIYDIIHNSQLR